MTILRCGTALLAGLLFLPSLALSQIVSLHRVFGRYQQFLWLDQHGLPQNGVASMLRTRDGYLWLATYGGVARFDGVRFTVFDSGNTSEIRTGLIIALIEDRRGDVWLGTDGDGLIRYSGGRFTAFTTQHGLASNHVQSLLEDHAGDLWIGTDGGGLSRFANGRFTSYRTGDGLPGNHVFALAADRAGALWVGTTSGLARFERNRFSTYTMRDGLADDGIRSLSWDREQALWIATARGGVSRFANGRFTTYGATAGLPTGRVRVVYHDREGTLWAGTDQGLYRLRAGRFEAYTVREGLPGNEVGAIYQDPDGDLWVGLTGVGLVQLRAPRFETLTPADGLASWNAWAVVGDAAGSLWIVGDSGIRRSAGGVVSDVPWARSLRDVRVRALHVDAEGRFWLACRGRLVRVTPAGDPAAGETADIQQWTRKDGLVDDNVFAVLTDRRGDVWIGTAGGLSRLHDHRITNYTTRDGLPDNFVLELFEDRAGALWIGTRSGGVSRFAEGRFTNWSTRDGLGNDHVLSFYEDRERHLWIGTHGGGLSRLANGRVRTVTTSAGLYDNLAFQILEDDRGDLWMCGNRGIYRASLRELNDVADGRAATVSSFGYGVTDGMFNRECNGGSAAGWKGPDGRLWFPTTRGVVSIDPSRDNARPPLVAIETVTIDRHLVLPGAAVRVEPGQRDLEIRYTALTWARAPQAKFRYRLAGLDEDWVDAGSRRTASYSRLRPGTYTFTVIADNGDGVWNREGKSLTFTVVPAFYQRSWFLAFVSLTVAGLAALAWRLRIRQFERTQAAQQAFSMALLASQERERKRIAAELHDSLGQHLLAIRTQAALHAMRTPADVTQAFTAFGNLISETIEEVRAISWNLRPSHLDQLGLRTALIVMIEKMSSPGSLTIDHAIEPCDRLLPPEHEITVYRIVQECLTNVVKHARATEALVTLSRRERSIEIEVRDNGQGFNAHIWPHAEQEQGGFGLTGIAERVRMLGGTHVISSIPRVGTVVSITFGVG